LNNQNVDLANQQEGKRIRINLVKESSTYRHILKYAVQHSESQGLAEKESKNSD